LSERGEKVCVLTRGYGRENSRSQIVVSDGDMILDDVWRTGDEPFEIALRLRGFASVIANPDRFEAAIYAKGQFASTAFVLDDAYQHFGVRRDLDIVCIDATNPFGNRKLLPRGILREPPANLKRADLIILTRAELAENIDDLKSEVSVLNPVAKIFCAKNRLKNLVDLRVFPNETPDAISLAENKSKHFFAFCAIGNPKSFFESLRRSDFKIAGTQSFRDHIYYTEKEIGELEKLAREFGADAFITTAKDAVKLSGVSLPHPCYVAEIDLQIIDREEEFRNLLLAVQNSN
jgi:tetraacyldisaccharide 4'-kinase